MKAIILNASPRKNWNTAQLLKAARQGATSTPLGARGKLSSIRCAQYL